MVRRVQDTVRRMRKPMKTILSQKGGLRNRPEPAAPEEATGVNYRDGNRPPDEGGDATDARHGSRKGRVKSESGKVTPGRARKKPGSGGEAAPRAPE